MIATIDIKVNAAHPNIPLAPLYAFEGSPSSVRVRNVPQRVGKWDITAVSVTIAMPDNSSTTVPAVAVGGFWVATLPSCDETGYCAAGLQVTADGTDENGAAVSGYCLGVGDVTILPRDATAVSNGTRYYLHYVAEQPANPNPGDMCYIDGAPKWYDGTAWQTFAGGASIDIVAPSTDPSASGKAADAKATGDALAGKLTRAEAEAGFTEWNLEGAPSGVTVSLSWSSGSWLMSFTYDGSVYSGSAEGSEDDTYVVVDCVNQSEDLYSVTASRTRLPTMADLAAKQDAIADLAAIRSGAALGATAVQPAALAGAVRYDLPASATNIADATQEEVEGGTIYYAEATLADRKANWLVVTTLLDELRLTFPAVVSGKVRDFGLRLEIVSQLTAPALVLPNGVTVGNPDGAIPEVADGGDNDNGVTLLYFSETAPDRFLVKGEEVKEVL